MKREINLFQQRADSYELLKEYFAVIDQILFKFSEHKLSEFMVATDAYIEGHENLSENRKIKINIDSTDDCPLIKLLIHLSNAKLLSNYELQIISKLGGLSRKKLLRGALIINENSPLFLILKKSLHLKLSIQDVKNIVLGLGLLARHSNLKGELTLNNVRNVLISYIDTLSSGKAKDNEICSFLWGITQLFASGIIKSDTTDHEFNRKLNGLIYKLNDNPDSNTLNQFLYSITRLCYFLGENFYSNKKLTRKLYAVLGHIEKNIDLDKLETPVKITLCNTLFYIMNYNIIHLSDFIVTAHKNLFSQIKELAPDFNQSKTQKEIKKIIAASYICDFDITEEVFMESGVHVDIHMRNKETGKIVVVECDGTGHNLSKDTFRDDMLKILGIKVVRINAEYENHENKEYYIDSKLSAVVKEAKVAKTATSNSTATILESLTTQADTVNDNNAEQDQSEPKVNQKDKHPRKKTQQKKAVLEDEENEFSTEQMQGEENLSYCSIIAVP